MIGRRCTHGNMFSRPVLIARTLSFTGKIKQETRFELICLGVFLSAKYCGGYSGGEPPLPIPNRAVKPAIADGTAPPGGRVGSCRSSKTRSSNDGRVFFIMLRLWQVRTLPTPRPWSLRTKTLGLSARALFSPCQRIRSVC